MGQFPGTGVHLREERLSGIHLPFMFCRRRSGCAGDPQHALHPSAIARQSDSPRERPAQQPAFLRAARRSSGRSAARGLRRRRRAREVQSNESLEHPLAVGRRNAWPGVDDGDGHGGPVAVESYGDGSALGVDCTALSRSLSPIDAAESSSP